jgi:hypothetical protein
MADVSDFERRQMVDARLAGASETKLPRCYYYYMYRERQFRRLCRHTRTMSRQLQRRGAVRENQHWQKEIVVHIFPKESHSCSTDDRAAELNIRFEYPVSTSQMQHSQ